MEDPQAVSYPTPSPQPGDLFDDNASEHEMTQHCAIQSGVSCPPQASSGQPETPQHGQYLYHYQYAYVPGGYVQQPMYYQTPPSNYYSPQLVQAPPAPTQQRYYYQQGTPTHPSQLEPVNLCQSMTQQVQPVPSVVPQPPAAPTNVDPPTIVQTPNRQRVVIWNYCQFCQNNREPESFFKSHILRDQDGRVICPVLRAYNCPICNNGGGDKAHTKSYCPQLRTAGRLTRKH